jgi:phosphatidylserine decarboxylase
MGRAGRIPFPALTRATPTTNPGSEAPPSGIAPPVPTGFLPDDPAPPIAREGWPIVASFVLGSVLLSAGGYWLLGVPGAAGVGAVCAALCLWCVWFFRDPVRRTPADEALVISPADGVVVSVGPAAPPPELRADGLAPQMPRVCIFMNVFNVHVNRSPVGGTIVGADYRPGKFFNASLDKASADNERSSLAIKTPAGHVLAVVQIAGLIARRIVSKVRVGDTRRAGQRYGLIRFGSRVDVYLPVGSEVVVKLGRVTVAGETVVARLPGTSAP